MRVAAVRRVLILASLALSWPGCSGAPAPTQFANPKFNFGFVEKVAVLPLENLSDDRQAGARATRLLSTELLATGAVEVVEPGEVQAALDRLPGGTRALTTEQVVDLGKRLGVQALLTGSVNQSEIIRSGTVASPVVTLDLHMIETETGTTVWAATQTARGGRLGALLLGTGAEPISLTTRKCVRELVATLVK